MAGKQQQAAKGAALSLATAMMGWGAQRLAAGDAQTGLIGVSIGVVVFAVYQALEERAHRDVYDDIVGSIGEERFRRLANHSDEVLDQLAEMDPDDARGLLGSGDDRDSQ